VVTVLVIKVLVILAMLVVSGTLAAKRVITTLSLLVTRPVVAILLSGSFIVTSLATMLIITMHALVVKMLVVSMLFLFLARLGSKMSILLIAMLVIVILRCLVCRVAMVILLLLLNAKDGLHAIYLRDSWL